MYLKPTALILILLAAINVALAQDGMPDARLKFSSLSVGLLIGYNQGQGTLDFQDQQHRFTIKGINVATVGFSQVDAVGQVYQLNDIKDFEGDYTVLDVGFTLFQGGGNTRLRNEKGVVLYLQNLQSGVELSLGGGGVSIMLGSPMEPKPEKSEPVTHETSS